jgi:hypothetical protein
MSSFEIDEVLVLPGAHMLTRPDIIYVTAPSLSAPPPPQPPAPQDPPPPPPQNPSPLPFSSPPQQQSAPATRNRSQPKKAAEPPTKKPAPKAAAAAPVITTLAHDPGKATIYHPAAPAHPTAALSNVAHQHGYVSTTPPQPAATTPPTHDTRKVAAPARLTTAFDKLGPTTKGRVAEARDLAIAGASAAAAAPTQHRASTASAAQHRLESATATRHRTQPTSAGHRATPSTVPSSVSDTRIAYEHGEPQAVDPRPTHAATRQAPPSLALTAHHHGESLTLHRTASQTPMTVTKRLQGGITETVTTAVFKTSASSQTVMTTHTYKTPSGYTETWRTFAHEGHPPYVEGGLESVGRVGAEALRAAADSFVKALEEGAPIVLPYAAATAVLAVCPECLPLAALVAGGVSFGVHKGISHESTARAVETAGADVLFTGGIELETRAFLKQIDKLLVQESGKQLSRVLLALLSQAREYDERAAFNHR